MKSVLLYLCSDCQHKMVFGSNRELSSFLDECKHWDVVVEKEHAICVPDPCEVLQASTSPYLENPEGIQELAQTPS